MNILSNALNNYFKPSKTKRLADPAYAAFRTYCKEKGLTGYIEFSDGVVFGHYSDWGETQRMHAAGGE